MIFIIITISPPKPFFEFKPSVMGKVYKLKRVRCSKSFRQFYYIRLARAMVKVDKGCSEGYRYLDWSIGNSILQLSQCFGPIDCLVPR